MFSRLQAIFLDAIEIAPGFIRLDAHPDSGETGAALGVELLKLTNTSVPIYGASIEGAYISCARSIMNPSPR